MKITVNKCRLTGKLFEDDKMYEAHLRALKTERNKLHQHQQLKTTFASWLSTEKEKIVNIGMIVPWFLKNQMYIMDAVNAGATNHRGPFGDKFFSTDVFENIALTVSYQKLVSNTHHCPHNGVQNWHCKNDLPRGYPGWRGQVSGRLKRLPKHMHSYPTSAALDSVGLHTGSGGGGNLSWSWGVSVFIADWPGLQEEVDIMEQDLIIKKLKGTA